MTTKSGLPSSLDYIVRTKELLSESRHRITLHDLVVQELKQAIADTTEEHFPLTCATNPQTIAACLTRYEDVTRDLRQILALIGFWGDPGNSITLATACSSLAERLRYRGATTTWRALRWHPLILISYSIGIAALAANKYDNLAVIFRTVVDDPSEGRGPAPIAYALGEAMSRQNGTGAFKVLPGHEHDAAPRSDYLFERLRPELEALFFLGRDCEACFDRFEMILSLAVGAYRRRLDRSFWVPLGRFAWEAKSDYEHSPLQVAWQEAESGSGYWPAFVSDVFPGGWDEFRAAFDALEGFAQRAFRY
jgi:hypothetical protein